MEKLLKQLVKKDFQDLKMTKDIQRSRLIISLKKIQAQKNEIDKICFVSKMWSPSWMLIRRYTQFNVKDFVDEQIKIWFPKIFKKKRLIYLMFSRAKLTSTNIQEKYSGKNI